MPDGSIDVRVPRIAATFDTLLNKLKELQGQGKDKDTLLAVVDWWMGKLLELKADIRVGRQL